MKELKKQHLEMLQLLESIEVMLQNGDSIHPNSIIRGAIQTAIGMEINLNQNNMKVKTFYVCNNTEKIEELINNWIVEVKPVIKIVTQCSSGRLDHHVTTTIFYEDGQ